MKNEKSKEKDFAVYAIVGSIAICCIASYYLGYDHGIAKERFNNMIKELNDETMKVIKES